MAYKFDSRGAALPRVLAAIIILFIGILVGTYVVSKQANPIILDEHGHRR